MPLLVVLLGVLIGYFISLVTKKDKENSAFLWGQILSCILLLVFATVRAYDDWKYRNYESNIESNRDVMQYEVNENEPYIRAAFNKLETSFSNPNELRLHSFHVHKQDTVINSVKDTVYTIYFTYFLNGSRNQERLSKFTVLQNKAELHFIHQLADTTKEYQESKNAFREENKDHIEEAEKLMKQMQEKGDQSVIDSLTKIYK